MADRREMLEAAMADVEIPQDEGKPLEEEHEEMQEEVSQDEPTRNEKGQFVAQDEAVAEEEVAEAVAEDEAEPEQPEEQPEVSDIPKPTTWKKDLLPLWDKIAKGETLTKVKKEKNILNTLTKERMSLKKALAYIKRKRNEQRLLRKQLPRLYPNSKHKESTLPHG